MASGRALSRQRLLGLEGGGSNLCFLRLEGGRLFLLELCGGQYGLGCLLIQLLLLLAEGLFGLRRQLVL